MNVGIVGYGTVGKSLFRIFRNTGHRVVIYDKYNPAFKGESHKDRINTCGLVFLAVPTPAGTDGPDLSAVEECVSWIVAPICLKSTVAPGTTNWLAQSTGKSIVFSPEYVGETPFHPYRRVYNSEVVVVGGERLAASRVVALYQEVLGPMPRYFITDATTAELAKYMENCYFATKIAFIAQFHELAGKVGADFEQMREVWLADSRIGRSHSAIVGSPGFGGRCLPKDLDGIIKSGTKHGLRPQLLEAVQAYNEYLHAGSARSGREADAEVAKLGKGSIQSN